MAISVTQIGQIDDVGADKISIVSYSTRLTAIPPIWLEYICLKDDFCGVGDAIEPTVDEIRNAKAYFGKDTEIIKRPGRFYRATVVTAPRTGAGEGHKIDTWVNHLVTDNSNERVSPKYIDGLLEPFSYGRTTDISGLSGFGALAEILKDHQSIVNETVQQIYAFEAFAKQVVK